MSIVTKQIATLTLAAAIVGCSATNIRGNGDIVSTNVSADAFNEISLSGQYSGTITVGEPETIKVTTDSNIQPYIKATVKYGRLSIKSERSVSSSDNVVIDVALQELNKLDMSGSSHIIVNGELASNLSSSISGSGSIDLSSLTTEQFDVSISGSGNYIAKGEVETLEVDISGSGSLDLSELNVGHAQVDISGSGNVKLGKVEKLDVKISGSGSLSYLGSTMLSAKTSGSGSVKAREE
jgi:hypothetical protein